MKDSKWASQPTRRDARRCIVVMIACLVGAIGSLTQASTALATGSDGSDGPTPYNVTTAGIQLPAGATFQDGGHVNIKATGSTWKDLHFEGKCITRTDAECSGDRHAAAQYIGKSFIPWEAFGLKAPFCVTWVQLAQYKQHFGEGGQKPVCVGDNTPPPPTNCQKSSPTYVWGSKVVSVTGAEPGTWLSLWDAQDKASQTLISKVKVGDDCKASLTVPTAKCESHQYQGDLSSSEPPATIKDTTGDGIADVPGWIAGELFTVPGDKSLCTPPPATPKDAAASVTVTPATCEASGTASVKDVKFATLVGTLDQSVGTHVATFKADAGHLFSNGSDTSQVSYTVSGKDKSLCAPKAPTADASAKACVKDGEKTGLVNVTVVNTDDDSDKSSTYNVVLDGATKQITLDDGKSGSVSFDGLAVGDYTVSVKGSDGTSTSTTVKVTKCDTPIVTPPPTTPPVATPPPVAKPVEVRAHLKKFRKCGADYFRVKKSAHVEYTANGKIIREGVKLKVTGKTVVRAKATGNSVLRDKRTWTIRDVTPKYCDAPPRKTPNTGI